MILMTLVVTGRSCKGYDSVMWWEWLEVLEFYFISNNNIMTKRDDVYTYMCSIIAEEDRICIPSEPLKRRKISKWYKKSMFNWQGYFDIDREDWFHATIQTNMEDNWKTSYSVYVRKEYWPTWFKSCMRTENVFHNVRSLRAACYIAEVAKANELWLSPLENRFYTKDEYYS